MRVEIESGAANASVCIEQDDKPLGLSVIARTNGLMIVIDDCGVDAGVMIHTTVKFADRLAKAIAREVADWKKRTPHDGHKEEPSDA